MEWVAHYNKGRPHSSLGLGVPDSPVLLIDPDAPRHLIPRDRCVVSKPILGGLHHEYGIVESAA